MTIYKARPRRVLDDVRAWWEKVLGIQFDVPNHTIHWYVSNLERHGVENIIFQGKKISLICEARKSTKETPVIITKGCEDIPLIVHNMS